jgi:signal transduction histidine kinase
MDSSDPIRLLILGAGQDTPALLTALLRGRIGRPFTILTRDDVPSAAEQHAYDVLLVEHDRGDEADAQEITASVGRVLASGAPPPLVLLGGSRNRTLEPALLAAGAADFIWKEELSAPLLESQIRHALGARQHAILERRYHEAQKLETVGRLAGGVAHDFNNLLTSIVGFGSLVAEQVKGNPGAESDVAEILAAAERAAVLTRQLLAFGRRQVLHPVRLQVGEAVQGVTSLIGRLIGDDIELTITCVPDLPPVRADRAQLEAALLNLVMNARDAMPHGGRLAIEASAVSLGADHDAGGVEVPAGQYVRISVSDSGHGIPADVQERIFEPFLALKEGRRGNGLALAAVYGIVKQSGGHILVSSQAGVGTTFEVYLPVDQSVGGASEEDHPAREGSRETGTVLLVEDADGIRRLAAEVIRRAGYRVLEARGPEEAVEVAAAHHGSIDLLLTDVMMPGGNGVDLAGRLVRDRPRLSVLFMSGYTDDEVLRNRMLVREAAFIQKPFTPQLLLRRVKEVLEVGAWSDPNHEPGTSS